MDCEKLSTDSNIDFYLEEIALKAVPTLYPVDYEPYTVILSYEPFHIHSDLVFNVGHSGMIDD